MDSITLAKHLRRADDRLQIVFITGIPDFITEGYEVSALNYSSVLKLPRMFIYNYGKAFMKQNPHTASNSFLTNRWYFRQPLRKQRNPAGLLLYNGSASPRTF